jgi:hypothetical protein
MNGPDGPELDRVDLPNVHERKEGPEGAVSHHLALRIRPPLNDRSLERQESNESYKKGLVSRINPSLLLKINLQNTLTLQLNNINQMKSK